MAQTTVRVREDTREALRELARATNEPMQEVLAKAVEAYRRRWILEQHNASYARLRQAPIAWAEELEERKLWEATLGDGLEPE